MNSDHHRAQAVAADSKPEMRRTIGHFMLTMGIAGTLSGMPAGFVLCCAAAAGLSYGQSFANARGQRRNKGQR